MHPDQHFAGARLRGRDLLDTQDTGRAELANDDGFQGILLVLAALRRGLF
jgi:hypothetical protein